MSGYAGLINAAVDDLSLSDDWLNGLDADEQRALKAAFQNGVEIASDAILAALSAPAPQGIGPARDWIAETPCRPGCDTWGDPSRKRRCDCGREDALALLPTEPPAQGEG